MRTLELLTAERLLAASTPESLYSCSVSEARSEFRQLVRIWHPDQSRLDCAPAVFSHIVHLYRQARRKLADGTWNEPVEKIEQESVGIKRFRCSDGSIKSVAYRSSQEFELGRSYISDHCVTFEVNNEFHDLYRAGRLRAKNLRFPDRSMAVEMSPFLPQIIDAFQTDGASILVLRKTPDQLLLSDVLSHCKGRIEPIEHLGWILNVLYNLCCYLEWSGIAHNAISIDSVFVSPLRHSGMLLGGWWYAAPFGAELLALNERALASIPPSILNHKRADGLADLEAVKAIGRELLGDATGGDLPFDFKLPSALIQWLRSPSSGSAARDYWIWKYEVLESSFGAPKFVDWKLDGNELYKEV